MKKMMLITGTTQGIGNEIYRQFKDEYEIITINRRDFPGVNYICDLSDQNAIEAVCKLLHPMKIDILINNAGGAAPVNFPDMTMEELFKCSVLNYHAPVMLMQAVLEGMKERGYGRIINISSIASKSPRTVIPHYAAATAALESFTKSMAVAYTACGITINSICPGGVETDTSLMNRRAMARLSGKDTEFYNNHMRTGNGLGRMIQPGEVAALIRFLLSDEASSISGQSVNICGIKEVH